MGDKSMEEQEITVNWMDCFRANAQIDTEGGVWIWVPRFGKAVGPLDMEAQVHARIAKNDKDQGHEHFVNWE
jgi:hypothetical protein